MKSWRTEVFDVNQLMFGIWSYIPFPAILQYTAVHSSWKSRLWPHQGITKTLLARMTKKKNNKKRSRVVLSNVRRTQYRQLKQIRNESQQFVAVAPPTNRVSATNPRALFACHVRYAIFTSLPKNSDHLNTMLLQLFTTYTAIDTVAIHGQARIIPESTQTYHSAYNSANDWRLEITRLCTLLKIWHASTPLLPHHLILKWCNIDHYNMLLAQSQLKSLIIYEAQFSWSLAFTSFNLAHVSFHLPFTSVYVDTINIWLREFRSCNVLRHLEIIVGKFTMNYAQDQQDSPTVTPINVDMRTASSLTKLRLQSYDDNNVSFSTLIRDQSCLTIRSLPDTFQELQYSSCLNLDADSID